MAKKVDPQKIIETIDNNILMGTVGVAMTIVGWGEATRTPTSCVLRWGSLSLTPTYGLSKSERLS